MQLQKEPVQKIVTRTKGNITAQEWSAWDSADITAVCKRPLLAQSKASPSTLTDILNRHSFQVSVL